MNVKKVSGLVLSGLFPLVVLADTDDVTTISPMIVVGSSVMTYQEQNLAGSVDTITRDEIAESHVDNTIELLNKASGTYLAPYNQGIISADLGIRGFAANGETPHAKLLIDGIPSNMHNGYTELDQLFAGDINSISVYKGTSDPRYGLYNLAGNYNVETRSDVARNVQATLGSFDTKELQGYWGEQTGDLKHSYFFGYRDAGGYRDHDHLEKFSLSGRWFYDISSATSLGFIARISGAEGDAPGYLTKEQAKHDPTQSASYARQDEGERDTQSYSVHLDHAFSDKVDWSVKAYFNQYQRERWVRFTESYSLQNRWDDQDHYGVISTLSWVMNEKWRAQWGLDVEYQDVLEQRFNAVSDGNGAYIHDRGSINRSRDYTYMDYGSYLQLNNTPVDWLEWNVALRADRLSGDYTETDNDGVSTDRDMYDFGTIVQPKANLFIYPTEDVLLFVNYGRSFQPVTGKSAYTAGDRRARDNSINDGWEAGIKWQPISSVDLRLSYWEQKAKDEYVASAGGNFSNIGKTSRKGFDTAIEWQITNSFSVWGNYATVDSEIESEGNNKGNELRSIPSYTASVGTTWVVLPQVVWRVNYATQGGAYLNEANTGGKYGDYDVVNTSVDYYTSWGSMNLQVNNLFDEDYGYAYDFYPYDSVVIYSPADGINGSVSITYDF